jgi:hypothetical protein
MNLDQARIEELVSRPSETLNVEIKGWIDPSTGAGISMIGRSCFAIRNSTQGSRSRFGVLVRD